MVFSIHDCLLHRLTLARFDIGQKLQEEGQAEPEMFLVIQLCHDPLSLGGRKESEDDKTGEQSRWLGRFAFA